MINFGLAQIKPEGCMVVDNLEGFPLLDKLPPLPQPKWVYPNGVYVHGAHFSRSEYACLLIKNQPFI